jgi:AcrR family transcriptional regulator
VTASIDITEQATVAPAVRSMRADARRNREKVIEAARDCMARDGLDAQMEEIAKAAGVGVGTVYRHFPNKDDLVEALAQERFQRLAELGREALDDPDAGGAFERFIRASALIQIEDRSLSEVLVSRPDVMMAASESVNMLALVEQVMSRAQEAGAIRADAEPRDVPMLMCALAGTHRMPKMDPERYIAIVLDGLRASAGSALPARPEGS